MTKSVPWEPKIFLDHFGPAEKLCVLIGIGEISMRSQIRSKRINSQALAYITAIHFEQTRVTNRTRTEPNRKKIK